MIKSCVALAAVVCAVVATPVRVAARSFSPRSRTPTS